MLRLHHAGAVLLLPDFSMDSVMAMARYAMTGEVEQLVTLGKILELPGMVQEVGGGRESWRHNETPRCSCHPCQRRGRRRRGFCWGETTRLVEPSTGCPTTLDTRRFG